MGSYATLMGKVWEVKGMVESHEVGGPVLGGGLHVLRNAVINEPPRPG